MKSRSGGFSPSATNASVEKALRHDVLPVWKSRALGSITRSDVVQLIESIRDSGRVSTAQHCCSQESF